MIIHPNFTLIKSEEMIAKEESFYNSILRLFYITLQKIIIEGKEDDEEDEEDEDQDVVMICVWTLRKNDFCTLSRMQ